MNTHGLDVSVFQGVVNWEQVKAAGCQFAMLRAGYGFKTMDPQFQRNASECNRIGLPMGVYWFCYAASPEAARQEADGCLNAIAPYRLDFPICYDIEQATVDYAAQKGITMTPALAGQIVESFCSRIKEQGYYAMFYSNRNFLNTYLPFGLSKKYSLWYACYNSEFDGTDCGMWQYTSQGQVPGINGSVDLDILFVDYPSAIKKAGLNHLHSHPRRNESSCANIRPPEVSVEDYISYVVQPGDTLSGIARRYGTSYQILAALNTIPDPDLIYPGQTIRLPEGGAAAAKYYTIRAGDTLSQIAGHFDTTVKELENLNGMNGSGIIYAGSTLRIT